MDSTAPDGPADLLTPSAACVARFREGLAALWPDGIDDPAARLGLAVSGGPDSTGLLLLAALATAHHADDQAETLLMRLNRASGVAGLAGARGRGQVPDTDIPLLRPLLGWRRAELGEIVTGAGLTAEQDPSNNDDKYDRVRIRKALADADWLDVAAVARSAEYIADADAALDWMAELEWRSCVRKAPMGLDYRPRAPRVVVLRVVARIVRELDGEEPRGSAVGRLLDALTQGRPASIGELVARPNAGGWSFSKAPLRAARRRT